MFHVQTNTEKLKQKREFLKLVETLCGVGLQCQVDNAKEKITK